jgi:threonine synthase
MVEAIENDADETRRWEDVETRATAIRIGNPVNAPKALPGIRETGGTAVAVSDEEITEAQRDLAGEGVGVEPASAASVAGLRKLREDGVVEDDESVVCLTTGHLLKDPEAAAEAGADPEPIPNDTDAILELIESDSSVGEAVRKQASKALGSPLALVAGGLGVAYLYRKLRSKE